MSKFEYNFVEQIHHYVSFEIVLLYSYIISPWKKCFKSNKHVSLYYTPVWGRKIHTWKNESMLQLKDLSCTIGLKYEVDSIFIFSFNKQYLTTTTSPAYNLSALYLYQPFFTLLNKPLGKELLNLLHSGSSNLDQPTCPYPAFLAILSKWNNLHRFELFSFATHYNSVPQGWFGVATFGLLWRIPMNQNSSMATPLTYTRKKWTGMK